MQTAVTAIAPDGSNPAPAQPADSGEMRNGVAASLAMHFGLLALGWMLIQPRSEPPSASEHAISIDLISMQDAVTEPSEIISEESVPLVSAGATQAASEPEAPKIVESDQVEPVAVVAARPVAAAAPVSETLEPVEAEAIVSAEVLTALAITETVAAATPLVTDAPTVIETVAPSNAATLERLDQAAKLTALRPTPEVQEITTASINPVTPAEPVESTVPVKVANLDPLVEPAIEEVLETPPVPAPRVVRKPVEAEEKPVIDKPVEKEAETPVEKPVEKKKTKQVASLGNGGENEADSAAAEAAGGQQGKVSTEGGNSAAYAGKVRAKVIKALKRPSGRYDAGEVRVSFTIDAGGRLVDVRLTGSSGDDKVDKAALAAVNRAAPFPSFSEGGSRSFTFPLMIQ